MNLAKGISCGSFMGLAGALRRILNRLSGRSGNSQPARAAMAPESRSAQKTPVVGAATPSNPPNDPSADYLEEIRVKLERLGEDFAKGRINRAQYEELYEHYQRQKRLFAGLSMSFSDPESARQAMASGGSMIIRRQREAEVVAYAIYSNETSLPIFTHGRFQMDPTLVVGMLSGLSSASLEMLGSGLRKTQVEDGKALCFVSGKQTTLVVLYSLEPSHRQETRLRTIHLEFERSNSALLSELDVDASKLTIPHDDIVGTNPGLRQLL